MRVLQVLYSWDFVSLFALIVGYAQEGQGYQALNYFKQVQRKGLFPDVVIVACILKAYSTIGAANKGEQVHDELAIQGLDELPSPDLVMWISPIARYAHCPARDPWWSFPLRLFANADTLEKAWQMLDKLDAWDAFSCNAPICLDKVSLVGQIP